MQLHRSIGKPDWAKTDPQSLDSWQAMAAATKGIITPGNIVTIAGFAIVILGLFELHLHRYYAGALLLAAGRLCDIIDGWLAELTRTKSPLGEALDVTVDKLEGAAAIAALGLTHIVPWLPLAAILLPHALISIMAVFFLLRGKRRHPSRVGKTGMALAWVSLVGFVLRKAVDVQWHTPFGFAVALLTALSVALGFYSAARYALGQD